MKGALLKNVQEIEVKDIDEELNVEADNVIVEIKVVSICGSDISYFNAKKLPYNLEYPLILGHEAAGIVQDVGKNVKHLKIGDRVAIEPGIWCGECSYCKSSNYNFCKNLTFMASKGAEGALKQYISWPSKCIFKLPNTLSFEEGALLEPLSVGYSAIEKLPMDNCTSIAILGAGSIGMLIGKLLSIMYSEKNFYMVDIFPIKKELGKRIGLKEDQFFIEGEYDKQSLPDFDVIIDTTGNLKVIDSFIEHLRYGGTLVEVGVNNQIFQQTFKKIVYKGLRIIGSYRYSYTYPKLIKLLSEKNYGIDKIITHKYGLMDTQKAFDMAQDKSCIKAAVFMDKEYI